MANVTTLQTRIALKYDLYENWKDSELVLLPGEIGLCEIPGTTKTVVENGKTVSITTAPTVLFKVGNNEKTPFKNLPWASAKAADVYSWAKASEVKRDGKKLVFVGGKEDGSNLEVEFDYVTLDEVKAITDDLITDVAALKEALAADGTTGKAIEDIKDRLDVIEGADTVEGSFAAGDKATLEAAKTYAESQASAAKTAAEATATGYNTAMNTRVEGLESFKASQETYNTNTTKAIEDEASARATAVSDEATARDNADKAIEAKIGSVTEGKTVVGMISDAQTAAAQDAADKVKALADGQVDTNKTDIANIKDVLLPAEAKAREDADKALDNRLKGVEAFFEGAAKDKEVEGSIQNALDTLVEIQEYLSGGGSAADGLMGQVSKNTNDIKDIMDIVGEEGTLTNVVGENSTNIAAIDERVEDLETLTSGFAEGETKGAIKTAIEAAEAKGQQGITDAADVKTYVDGTFKTAIEGYADKAEEDAVKAAKDYVDPKFEAQAAANEAFTDEDERLAGLISDNADEISTLKNTTIPGVVSGYEAADLVINNKIGTKTDAATVDTVYGAIADAKKAGTDAADKADANTTRIEAVEGNYVKYVANADVNKPGRLVIGKDGNEDYIIFNCGSATELV